VAANADAMRINRILFQNGIDSGHDVAKIAASQVTAIGDGKGVAVKAGAADGDEADRE
jgi:hypothetical protein